MEDSCCSFESFPLVEVDSQALALADASVPESDFFGRAGSGRRVGNFTSTELASLFLSREHGPSAEVCNDLANCSSTRKLFNLLKYELELLF